MAAMVLSPRAWYPTYPRLADQELAGVVMWAFGGMAAVIAGAGLFASWLRAGDGSPDDAGDAAPALVPA